VGLFVIPHDAGPSQLVALASGSDTRAATGLAMIALGTIAAIVGGFGMGARANASPRS